MTDYAIDIYTSAPVSLGLEELNAALSRRHAGDAIARGDGSSLLVEASDGGRWSVTTDLQPVDFEAIASSLQQSFQWREAASSLGASVGFITVSELHCGEAPLRDRIERFRRIVAAVVDGLRATAIHWRPSQQFIDPEELLQTIGADDPLYGAMNVRMFRIDPSEIGPFTPHEEFVMDTIGLAPLGLPDVQIHFRQLDRGRVAQLLYNTGYYMFDRGIEITDGHSVEGIAEGTKWICRRETSLMDPKREVVDLDPGKPFRVAEVRAAN
jgi:hypothetical protein